MTMPDAGRAPRKDLLAFDRSDRWGLTALLGLVMIVALGAWVVGPLVGWAGGGTLPVELLSPVTVPELDVAGLSHGLATYDVAVVDPGAGQRLLAMVPGLLWLALVATACWVVLGLMRSIAGGEPFATANVRRLRVLAAVLVLGVPVGFFLDMAVRGALLAQLDLGGLSAGFSLDFPWLATVGGMVVALLAEAFRAGSRLREDVEGLV